ncbi:DcuS/MalK family sensor histidine kinase [Bacillus sp. USDA818B3_A]|uniref:DcuS/MalK family sensor histidine kinase n=1 Tax=Bacillus sp. USDA818B3_A TaxID=2698834 RepID=UPI00136D0129|nr:DcuS/MalK family sensor histidine kinase [Bacillus sp. USDA818B3_A]
MKLKFNLPLRYKITFLVCGVSILCLLVTNYFIQRNFEQTIIANIEEKAKDISKTAALSPVFVNGLSGKDSDKTIQQYAEKMRKAANVSFLVVLDMNGIRKSHPLPSKIGKKYAGGDAGEVFKGHEHMSIAKGTLGKSLRYFTPVYSQDGKQIGAILVGVLIDDVERQVAKSTRVILFSMLLGIIVGLISAILLANKVKKILFGMEPVEIAHQLEQRSAILEYAREGIIAVDQFSRITLLNKEASRLIKLMGIYNDPIGMDIGQVMPQFQLSSLISGGAKILDKEYSFRGLVIVANIVPIYVNQQITGAVATFRDKTEIKQMAEQLTGARAYAEALRAQTHEFMNKLHVIQGLVTMKIYDKLTDYVKQISHSFQTEVGYLSKRIKDPVIAGFIIGKASYARENGAKLMVTEKSYVPKSNNNDRIQDLVTILGNLIDNAIDSLQGCKEKIVEVEVCPVENHQLSITVSDTGTGMNREIQEQVLEKGFSTKGDNRGIGLYLVFETIKKLNGKMTISSKHQQGTTIHVSISLEGEEQEL